MPTFQQKRRKNIITYSLYQEAHYLDNEWGFHYSKVCEGENPNCEIMLLGSLHVVNVACVMEFDLKSEHTKNK